MAQITPIPPIRWKPDKQVSLPLYEQIIRFVCHRVAAGDWAVGMRLPPQRELAAAFDVNRSTVVTAITNLIENGILETDHGAGTTVSGSTWSLLMKQAVDWNDYTAAGMFKANVSQVQAINRYEADASMMRLGTGELSPDLFPRKLWRRALCSVSRSVASLGYAEPLGLLPLREALVEYLAVKGIQAAPSSILVTSGSLQALQLISVSMLQPGASVYTEAPTYLKSLQLFQSAGMHLEGIPVDEGGLQYWRIPADRPAVRRRSILYTIPTNHNPTGVTMNMQRRRELIDFCTRRQLPVIEDDAYGALYFGKDKPLPLKSFDKNGVVIYLGTTSKSLAAGLRIGWLLAPEAVVQRLGDVKMQMDYGASSLSQLVFANFMATGMYDEYTAFLRTELLRRRNNALQVLTAYFSDIAEWNVPMGGFYIWVTLRRKISMDLLFRKAIKEKLLLNPGDIYDFNPNHSLRISYAYLSCDAFAESMQRLAELIRNMGGRSA